MLGKKIKQLRNEKGMTQDELATRLSVVRQTVSKWEKGFAVPDAEMIVKIADALGTTVNDLLGSSCVGVRDCCEADDAYTDESGKSKDDAMMLQFVRINEQLEIKNERTQKMWRTSLTLLIIAAVGRIAMTILCVLFLTIITIAIIIGIG